MDYDITDSVKISIQAINSPVIDSVKISTSGIFLETDSTNISIQPFNLVGVTSVCGTTINVPNNPIVLDINNPAPTQIPTPGDVSEVVNDNPFYPTIIAGGTVFVYNASTAPLSYDSNTYFIQWLDTNIPNNDSCQILDFSFNLSLDGGNFALLTTNEVGDLKSQISIFTLTGTITRKGKKMSSGAYGPTVKGIFGSPRLNEEFDIIALGNQNYIRFLSNQYLRPFLINNEDSMTVWDMVRNIAVSAGINISFNVVDAPYTDSISQSGQTGLSALSSLASQVGGQLRWNGGDTYSIVYPNHFAGTFTVPTPYILTPEAIEYEGIYDLGLGVTGTGTLGIPKSADFSSDTNNLPSSASVSVPFTQIQSIRQAVTSDDPLYVLDIPPETSKVLYRTRVAPGQQTSVSAGITSNLDQWFELSTSPLNQSYWRKRIRNGALVAEIIIGPNLYPDSVPAISSGNFITEIAIEQLDLSGNFAQDQKASRNSEKDQIARMLANIRYIKTYEGNISCYFFGAIPIPGMWASATNICGETVEGIVESVSFSSPGILNISVAQYLRLNFLEPGVNINSQPLNQVF